MGWGGGGVERWGPKEREGFVKPLLAPGQSEISYSWQLALLSTPARCAFSNHAPRLVAGALSALGITEIKKSTQIS